MKNILLLALTSIVLLTACNNNNDEEESCADFSLRASDISNVEESLVVEAILDSVYNYPAFAHLSQESGVFDNTDYFQHEFFDLSLEIIEEYRALNRTRFVWGESIESAVTLINQEELICLLGESLDDYLTYFAKYEESEGYFRFGRPVFEGETALIAFDRYCGSLCGSGYAATLIKQNDEWLIETLVLVWTV